MVNKAKVNAILQTLNGNFNMIKSGIWLMILAMIWALSGCSEEIQVAGFEVQKWKDDPNGCNGSREKNLTVLLAGQAQLIGRSEMEIKTFLGKPDMQDLRTRGMKFFEYGVKGGNLCNPQSLNQPEILRIRFDALDRVNEVAIY